MSQKREPVIGIDLGTTYSAVATVENGIPRVIPSRQGHRLTPSMVGFTRSGERVVGERARLLLEDAPDRVAVATKRFIGRRFTEALAAQASKAVSYALMAGPQGEVRINLGNRVLPLPQISGMVLGELKLDAEAYFGRPVSKAVITVPANFDDAQRQATKEAASIAGLNVMRIVNEPTAACVAYGLTGLKGRVLVFDLGGGTFDVSVLEIEEGVFQVKATGGEPYLGGEDFDHRVVEWLIAQLEPAYREPVSKDALSMQRLKLAAEKAKRWLTTHEEAVVAVEDLGDHSTLGNKDFTRVETALTRSFFDRLSEPLTRRCLEVCKDVMAQTKMAPGSMDEVLLVGGMTRVPLIRSLVTEVFGKTPQMSLNPDEVVALGAALHAQELADQGGAALLMDVASHSLGVGIVGGKVKRVIEKNVAIPVSARETFFPSKAGQTEARIPIFQGESDSQAQNTKLGELVLRQLHVQERAARPLEVSFEISAEGTVTVRALDVTTGMAEACRIEARTELGRPELDTLRKEEAAYAQKKRMTDLLSVDAYKELLSATEAMAGELKQVDAPEAKDVVKKMDEVLEEARAALNANDARRMTEAAKHLKRLTAAR